MIHRLCLLLLVLVTPWVRAEYETITTEVHKFEKVADGVYFVTGIGKVFVMSNSLVIVNDDGVVVVDSHITPAAARSLITDIKRVTDKPVTTLINSHFHYDHSHGNQSFGPDIEIIGHEFTRARMTATPLEEATFLRDKTNMPKYLEGLQTKLAATTDEAERRTVEGQIEMLKNHIEATKEITPLAPNVTMNDRMTLFRGGREIQLLFLGRAHTAGDIAIFLPKERVVFTGDMMLGGVSWLGDGYVDEWPATLEKLKALDFDIMLPGHGPIITERNRIDFVQAYYRDLWQKARALHDAGVTAENAAKQVDLTAHAQTLGVAEAGADPLAVSRIYELLDGPAKARAQ